MKRIALTLVALALVSACAPRNTAVAPQTTSLATETPKPTDPVRLTSTSTPIATPTASPTITLSAVPPTPTPEPSPTLTPSETPNPKLGYPGYFRLGETVTYRLRGTGPYADVDSVVTLREIDYGVAENDIDTPETPPDAEIFTSRHCGCQAPCREAWDLATEPAVVALAASIVTDADTPLQRARKIYQWVEQHFAYEAESAHVELQDLYEYLIERGRGHCAAQSLMFIALCRANPVPIPSRIVCGTWYLNGAPALHHWAEFYLEGIGWIPVDTTISDLVPGAESMDGFGRLGADHMAGCPTCDCPPGGWHFLGTMEPIDAQPRAPFVQVFPRALGWTGEEGHAENRVVIIGSGFRGDERVSVAVGYLEESGEFRAFSRQTVEADASGQFHQFRVLSVKGIAHQWRIRCRGLMSGSEAEVCFWTQ
jgi:transglutaminase-like putative cysteine protease